MQDQAAQQVVEALKKANNVMVTVKNSPSVDELTAAVGLTLMLNHMNKHATTVFSGQIPSTIEFLQPEMAIESTTDSLRDFIIALDKSKADKLRYKVEENVVRIYITPYKTSITDQDLEFSQGDFNVDVVIALGVISQQDFDQAVTAHGKILHDATVIGVTKQEVASQIGALNWHDAHASSVSEMISSISELLGPKILDSQIATALMTGMVSETDRFRNERTTPKALTLSAKLMTAGANQQLIADKLEEVLAVAPIGVGGSGTETDADGMLEIPHAEDEVQDIHIDSHGNMDISQPEDPMNQPTQLPNTLNSQAPVQMPPPEALPEEEIAEPEVKAHDYITSSQPAAPVENPPLSNSLFSDQATHQESHPIDNLGSPQTDSSSLEHAKKVIAPLSPAPPNQEQVASPSGNLQQMPAESQQTSPSLPPPPSPGRPKTALPTTENQSLADLETAANVDRPATGQVPANVDDFTGTSAPQEEGGAGLPPPPKPGESTKTMKQELPVNEPAKQDKPDIDEELETAPPADVINPGTAPSVPPPIVPPTPTNPQFFEADGSKSNPFLNPADKK